MGFSTASPQHGVKYQLWYLDFPMGGAINLPLKITKRQQNSFSIEFYLKDIARTVNWVKCQGRILHLKPTAGCQISTLIFGLFWGGLWISHEKLPKDGNILSHFGFFSKILPGPLTEWIAWVGFSTSSARQGVKYQLWYLDYFLGGGLQICHNNLPKYCKVLSYLGFISVYCPGL